MICNNCGVEIEEFKDYWRDDDNLPFCDERCLDEYNFKPREILINDKIRGGFITLIFKDLNKYEKSIKELRKAEKLNKCWIIKDELLKVDLKELKGGLK